MSGVGDRRDEDLREMGRIAAGMFDRLIIRRGDHLRGRSEESVYDLLQAGIKESGRNPEVKIVKETEESVLHALDSAQAGELVVILADSVQEDLAIVNQYREKIARSDGNFDE